MTSSTSTSLISTTLIPLATGRVGVIRLGVDLGSEKPNALEFRSANPGGGEGRLEEGG
jgi:hypothetical protein